jgi:hypothetical protein
LSKLAGDNARNSAFHWQFITDTTVAQALNMIWGG